MSVLTSLRRSLRWFAGTIFSLLIIVGIGAIIVGTATGIFFSSNWALGAELVPYQEAGKYMGISNLADAGAGAIGGTFLAITQSES